VVDCGTWLATLTVGEGGAAVGQAIEAAMTIKDMLLDADQHAFRAAASAGFVLHGRDYATRDLAGDLFGNINGFGGDIS
jgi:hypothetical protein